MGGSGDFFCMPFYDGDTYGVMGAYEFCFSKDTLITVLGKDQPSKRSVSTIKKDDYVLTLKGNEKVYSKVKENIMYEKVVPFYTFKLKDKSSKCKYISVTANHSMIIFNKNEETYFKYANQVVKGDLIRTIDGIGEVIEIKKEVKQNCYKLVVEQGSVLANDILVGAMYFRENENRKQFDKILESAKIPIEIKN